MSERCRVGESMASDYYEHAAECPECRAHEATKRSAAPAAVADHPDIPALVARLEALAGDATERAHGHEYEYNNNSRVWADEELRHAQAEHANAKALRDAATALSRLTREVEELRVDGWCDVCTGTGVALVGGQCVACKGTGKLTQTVTTLRYALHDSERERDEARAALARYEADHAKTRP